jgi:hypothetical protein
MGGVPCSRGHRTAAAAQRLRLPEEMEWTSRDVQKTDAWSDRGDPVRTYELVCERLDVEPKRQLGIR